MQAFPDKIYLLDFSGIFPSPPWGRGNFAGKGGVAPVPAQAKACGYIFHLLLKPAFP
jgi:hypothetical protein